MNRVYLILLIPNFLFSQLDTIITIDASAYSDWVYYSFEQDTIVDVENPENSLEWDLAIQRKHMKTNSGLAGIGNGGAYVDSSLTWVNEWSNINALPENITWIADTLVGDFYDPNTHTFIYDVKNPALNSWGWFDEDYHLNETHYVLFVKLANGTDAIKFWPFNYYNQNGVGGYITIKYQKGLQNQCDNLLGDINDDGIINVVDIIQMVNCVINNTNLDECELSVNDLNEDGIVNVIDIIALVNLIIN